MAQMSSANSVLYVAPLCPAGHLPLKGGDCAGRLLAKKPAAPEIGEAIDEGLISPLEGEMSGRTEGGAKGRNRPNGSAGS